MLALVCTTPGNFEYKELAMPVLEKGFALLKIKQVGVCGTDLHAFEGTQPYFSYPRILGHELAAEIADINGDTEFAIGEEVTVIPYLHCGNCIACNNGKPNCCVQLKVCGVHIDGGMCEYYAVPVSALLHGNGLTTDQLAITEPLAIGAHGIKRAAVNEGENVLITGAGPIGIAAMHFAAIAGAKVIMMDINEKRLAFCKQILPGIETVDVAKENPNERLRELTNGNMAEVVIDATGNLKAMNNAFQFMAHGGRYVLIGLQKDNISFSHPEFHKREATLMSSRNATRSDFEYVLTCLRNNKIDTAAYITSRVKFRHVKDIFPQLLKPESEVIKAMIEMY